MKTFPSFMAFHDELFRIRAGDLKAIEKGLAVAAKLVQKKAKSEIGHLQSAAGPYPAWEELADYTKDDKSKKGYVYNSDFNPLLRTGELRDSIDITLLLGALEAIIGSKSEIMAYQEYGTRSIPPRPVIGRAAFVSKEKIKKALGITMLMHLKSRDVSLEQFAAYVYEGKE